jgi:hypothetical protein
LSCANGDIITNAFVYHHDPIQRILPVGHCIKWSYSDFPAKSTPEIYAPRSYYWLLCKLGINFAFHTFTHGTRINC